MKNMNKWTATTILPLLCLLLFTWSASAADSLCARVKIEIRQEATLERQAFDAHMRINNGLSHITLENVDIDVTFSDEDGNAVLASSDPGNTDALFFITIDSLDNINDVNGSGTVQPSASADIHWLIIPAPGASNGLESGTLYNIGATLRYTIGGEENVTEVSPDYIFVKPMPELVLDYFLPKQVYGDDAFTSEIEPPIPFSLGVRVTNNGSGVAGNLKIDSSQPKIKENEQGLLIGFIIEGSEVNGQEATESLLVDFGDIEPNTSGVARWIMTVSLSGQFVEFSADYSHSDELGGELTSLLEAVNTHFLVWDVLVDLPGRDDIRDFLARDGGVYRVYESDSTDTDVMDQSASSSLQLAGQSGLEVKYTLSTPGTAGFMYVQLPDPHSGQKVLKEVMRSDGKRVKPENAWLSKTREGSDPWQHFFNLFDTNTTGLYTVIFEDAAAQPDPPVLQFIPDRNSIEGQQLSFIVVASDPDGTIPMLSARPLPVGTTFTDQGDIGNGIATGIFDWTPAAGQAGRYEITFTASDGVLEDSQRAVLTIYRIGDTDGDGYLDEDEVDAGSDPNNPDSVPASTALNLYKGYNLVNYPAELMSYDNILDLMEALGGNTVISRILIFDQDTGTYNEIGYDDTGRFYGQNFSLLSGQGIGGMIIFVKQDATFTFTSKYCHTWDLSKGTNLVGFPCAPEGFTAFQLLQKIGNEEVVSSIQRFNRDTGMFESTGYLNRQSVGVNFQLKEDEGYFIYLNQDELGFRINP